jgi:DNA-binding winged helix-turn-helix (wHTH) protein
MRTWLFNRSYVPHGCLRLLSTPDNKTGENRTISTKAVSILEFLMLHPDEVLSRERILDAVWGWDYPAATRTVDTRIAELRRVLNDAAEASRFIETLIGQGYRFIGKVEAG